MRYRTLLAAVCVLCLAQFGVAQQIERNTLTVRGKSRVFAKADRAKIQFSVKGIGSTLDKAFADARRKVDAIKTALLAVGLEEKNLSTSFFRSEDNYGDKAFLSSKKDFRALTDVTVTTERLDLVERVVIAISEGDIEGIDGVWFELINPTQLRQDAVLKATEAAKAKATVMATGLGITCGEVLACEELSLEVSPAGYPLAIRGGRASSYNIAVLGYETAQESGGGAIFPNEMQFDAEVKVVYSIRSTVANP